MELEKAIFAKVMRKNILFFIYIIANFIKYYIFFLLLIVCVLKN